MLKTNKYLVILLSLLFPASLLAQSCGFSEGKSLAQLRAAVFEKEKPRAAPHFFLEITNLQELENTPTLPPLVLLPKWSADELPFFCRIEHDWSKKSRLPVKFRLGSVEYVDWLEGKQSQNLGH